MGIDWKMKKINEIVTGSGAICQQASGEKILPVCIKLVCPLIKPPRGRPKNGALWSSLDADKTCCRVDILNVFYLFFLLVFSRLHTD